METLIQSEFYAALFIGLGLILGFLEFFIPSGGVLGILALGCSLFGIYAFFAQSHPLIAVAVIVADLTALVLGLRYGLRRFRFAASLGPEASTSVDERIGGLAGTQGVTYTALRPAGVAIINGRRVDVVSPGYFIDQNVKVQVIEITGNRVVVRELEEGAKDASQSVAR
jgi:membrane-bound serine protease (ClpP class)